MTRLLDWRAAWHFARAEALCRFCREPTHLRDDYLRPTHKVCAESHPAQTAEPPRRTRTR